MEINAFSNDVDSLERAVVERIFLTQQGGQWVPPPPVAQGAFPGLFARFNSWMHRKVGVTTPMTRQQFAASYRGRKRTIYERAAESLRTDPVSRKDARVKAFVKREKTNFTVKRNPCPRVIQPRDPRYNVEVGKFLRPMEHKIYQSINEYWGERVVAKGRNMVQRAESLRQKWSRYRKPMALKLDAKRFDQHVREEALRWEHSVYLSAVARSDRAELGRLLDMQLRNIGAGYVDGGVVRYRTNGTRCSGDMNTALGNVLLMCAMVIGLLEQQGSNCTFEDDGDDCLLIGEERDILALRPLLVPWFLQFGFEIDDQGVASTLSRVEFCQARPVFDGKGWIMVRVPEAGLAKDVHSLVALDNQKVYRMWASAVGHGGLSLAGGIPVYDALYRWYVKESAGARPLEHPFLDTGFAMHARKMAHYKRENMTISDQARISFWEAFGIDPADQVLLEEHYRSAVGGWHTPELVWHTTYGSEKMPWEV